MTDQKLLQLCKKYGRNALVWRQKFLGLLPEVWKRRLYQSKGFNSIFEFAAKVAGVSQEQVRLTLNLESRFLDKPALHNLLVSGEVSINKLSRVVSIASLENQEELAEQVKILPARALETLVRDERNNLKIEAAEADQPAGLFQDSDGLSKPENNDKSLHVQTEKDQAININEQLKLLNKLPSPLLGKLLGMMEKGIDVGQLLTDLLEQYEQNLGQEKDQIAEHLEQKNTRYIPVKVKQILFQEFGRKCAIPACQKPAQNLHHTNRFALSRSHDPRFLAPLCQGHHLIAHAVDRKFNKHRYESQYRLG